MVVTWDSGGVNWKILLSGKQDVPWRRSFGATDDDMAAFIPMIDHLSNPASAQGCERALVTHVVATYGCACTTAIEARERVEALCASRVPNPYES